MDKVCQHLVVQGEGICEACARVEIEDLQACAERMRRLLDGGSIERRPRIRHPFWAAAWNIFKTKILKRS